jgi:biopolymer transport protein ExbD
MEEKSFDYMNVIPLVDVMLVLLTIVLMASTFVVSGAIPVRLPVVSQQQKDTPLKTVTVTIDQNSKVYFDSTPVTASGLRERMVSVSKGTPVIVRADRSISVQSCVDVLGVLNGAGFRKVALQTDSDRQAGQ